MDSVLRTVQREQNKQNTRWKEMFELTKVFVANTNSEISETEQIEGSSHNYQ